MAEGLIKVGVALLCIWGFAGGVYVWSQLYIYYKVQRKKRKLRNGQYLTSRVRILIEVEDVRDVLKNAMPVRNDEYDLVHPFRLRLGRAIHKMMHAHEGNESLVADPNLGVFIQVTRLRKEET